MREDQNRMRRVRLTYSFEFAAHSRTGQDIPIELEAFGTRCTIGTGDVDIDVRIPEYKEDLAGELTSGYGQVGDPAVGYMLRAFELTAEYDESHDLDALEAESDRRSTADGPNPLDLIEEIDRRARAAATRFVAWIKVDHPWLGASHIPPRVRAGPAVIDVETGRELRLKLNEDWPAHKATILGKKVLSVADIEALAKKAIEEEGPPLFRSLLADARDAVHWSTPPDPKIAILFAAIATEFHLRQTLVRGSHPDARPLVDTLLPGDSQALLAVKHWPTKVAKVAMGRSLADDDSRLNDQFGKLVSLRNQLAHQGLMTEETDEVRELVSAAMKIAEWIDGLPTPTG